LARSYEILLKRLAKISTQWRRTRSIRHGKEGKRDGRVVVAETETETKNQKLAQGSEAVIST
jgi:hypothetical protein